MNETLLSICIKDEILSLRSAPFQNDGRSFDCDTALLRMTG